MTDDQAICYVCTAFGATRLTMQSLEDEKLNERQRLSTAFSLLFETAKMISTKPLRFCDLHRIEQHKWEVLQGRELTPNEHWHRHAELHASLDELAGDFVETTKQNLSSITLLDFVVWSGDHLNQLTEAQRPDLTLVPKTDSITKDDY